MPKMRKKADLPSKPCVVCGRPFVWRKKWEKVWTEVKFCSDACRMRKNASPVNDSKSPGRPPKKSLIPLKRDRLIK